MNITVFERSEYVGGRSTTVNVFGDERYPIELGASIFVSENKILRQAADEFGLELTEYEAVYEEKDVDELGMYVRIRNCLTIVGTALNLSIL